MLRKITLSFHGEGAGRMGQDCRVGELSRVTNLFNVVTFHLFGGNKGK